MKTTRDLFAEGRDDWLDTARVAARKLLMERPTITIVDVLEVAPRPQYVHRNATGSVFNHRDFKLIGHIRSNGLTAHKRHIGVWTLNEDAMPFIKKRKAEYAKQG